ncbi:probable S-adenosylmethionine carrier 2, chloroplastic [Asparagus officinalis]|uniref:probable S-adenosylmethionine carrier 2, chloroplastic n=1 Tax=Asparagus officinalis TaxID=4686 RepID=UPI00098DF5E5|nr:probable S-adenosylmethionine carrier 2, chloroplastic [Asparagus officinalis]
MGKGLRCRTRGMGAAEYHSTGAIGGAASSLIRVPTEVVKQRMQTGQFASAPDAVRLIAAKEGFKGLYAGYSFFLLRDLPFDAIQFCLYEQLRIGYKIAVL